MTSIRLTVNGHDHDLDVEPRRTLAEVLREELRLTGTHLACEHGVCGACSVTLDGAVVRSCLTLGVQADGCAIGTVEGLGRADELGAIQRGFLEALSFQCGFCTPGIVVTTAQWIDDRLSSGGGAPTDDEIREMLAGNLCRCTGYQAIVDGVAAAWRRAVEEVDPCND